MSKKGGAMVHRQTRREDVLYRKLDDCCDGNHDPGQITNVILKSYSAERKQVEQDVLQTLRKFTELGLLKGSSNAT